MKGLGFKHHGNHPGNHGYHCYTCIIDTWPGLHLYHRHMTWGHLWGEIVTSISYIFLLVCMIVLQYNKHNQPVKSGFSLVAEQRSKLLRKSRSPSFFKKNSTKKSSSPLQEQSIERRSPLRGPVHWEVQSIERGSPVRGPVRWRFSVEKTLHRYSSVRGAVHREVQSIERHSPLRGAVHWEAQSFERFSVVRGRRLQRRELCEKIWRQKEPKISTRQKTVSFQ